MEKVGTSSVDRTRYFKEPSPEMEPWKKQVPALEIGPSISRNQLWYQRQLWIYYYVFQGNSSGDRTMYYKEPALVPALDLGPRISRNQLWR